jgi:EAL domain-containing protein (putative c-di-GMP-specific phosphodiesterase class I)
MRWVTRLQQSLDDDLLELHAQRILPFDGDGADPLQVELLLRIREPDGSLVLPAAFLPPAERFQIVNRLDLWVLRRTLDLLEAQPALEGIGRICLNVSGQSVADRSFLTSTQELLDRAGPQVCRRLCFEITETAAISNEAAAGAFIASLRQRHCSVALDDFGSGMASFGSLKTLALTHLKIDGQFVRGLIDDRLDGVAVRCFVEVAAVLGLRTVAESVESAVVLERLRQIGVHEAQGYHLHRPEPFAALLTRTLANPPG